MKITDEALDEFIVIYKTELGEEINRKEASEMALRMLRLYELLARKLPNEQMKISAATRPTDGRPPIGFRT